MGKKCKDCKFFEAEPKNRGSKCPYCNLKDYFVNDTDDACEEFESRVKLGKLTPEEVVARRKEIAAMEPKPIKCKFCGKTIPYTPSNKLPPVFCPKSKCSREGNKQNKVVIIQSEKGIIREGRVI